jgi:E3 ubiquitin-protein ligase listerin
MRASIVSYIRDRVSTSQSEAILGSWCLSSWDIDRTVARESNRSWAKTIRWKHNGTGPDASILALEDDQLTEGLTNFACDALLAPDSLYLAIFPPAVQSFSLNHHSTRRLPGRQAPIFRESVGVEIPRKSELDEESEDDRRARLRAGSLGSLKWLLGITILLGASLVLYLTINSRFLP